MRTIAQMLRSELNQDSQIRNLIQDKVAQLLPEEGNIMSEDVTYDIQVDVPTRYGHLKAMSDAFHQDETDESFNNLMGALEDMFPGDQLKDMAYVCLSVMGANVYDFMHDHFKEETFDE